MTRATPKRIREVLRYDPSTGDLYWKMRLNPRGAVGSMAGKNSISGPAGNGYRIISVDRVRYRAHHLVWVYFHGVWPTGVVDHINGNPLDNRIENLRDVTQQQNTWNMHRAMRNNKSGVLGVDWVPKRKKWRAQIRRNNKKECLGFFDSVEAAGQAYQRAKKERL